MYNQTYEDYMKSVLGYSFNNNDYCGCNPTYENNYVACGPTTYQASSMPAMDVACMVNLDEMYPEIYKIVNPMICKACDENRKPITNELIMEMAESIYTAIEVDEKVTVQNRSETKKAELKNGDDRNPNVKPVENREILETRQSNHLLKDLILILLLNRLGGGRPPRPPFPGPGGPGMPRPPFPGPGGPGMPRPPFPGGPGLVRPPRPEPRDYGEYVQF